MKIEVKNFNQHYRFGTMLYDTETDPYQESPISDPEIEAKNGKPYDKAYEGKRCSNRTI